MLVAIATRRKISPGEEVFIDTFNEFSSERSGCVPLMALPTGKAARSCLERWSQFARQLNLQTVYRKTKLSQSSRKVKILYRRKKDEGRFSIRTPA